MTFDPTFVLLNGWNIFPVHCLCMVNIELKVNEKCSMALNR